jgi:serine/threonine protein kinase
MFVSKIFPVICFVLFAPPVAIIPSRRIPCIFKRPFKPGLTISSGFIRVWSHLGNLLPPNELNSHPVGLNAIFFFIFIRPFSTVSQFATAISGPPQTFLFLTTSSSKIVQILDAFATPSRDSYEELYIVCELMDFDLHKLITSSTPLGQDHVKLFMYQLLLGLKCMHSAQVLHRDLKPKNILVNRRSGELKICDLGMGRTGASEAGRSQLRMTVLTEVATPFYRAPDGILNLSERAAAKELSAPQHPSSSEADITLSSPADPSPTPSDSTPHSASYTSAVDMWACGCILAELVLRKPLFPGRTNKDLLDLIIKLLGSPSSAFISRVPEGGYRRMLESSSGVSPQPWSSVFPASTDATLIDLISKLLRFDPDERITVDQALGHPYLEELHDAEDESAYVASRFMFPEDEEKDSRDVRTYRDLLWREVISFSAQSSEKPQS